MVVHDLDIPGVPAAKLEGNAPWTTDRDRPLSATGTAKAMEPDRRQPGKVSKAFGLIEKTQPPTG